MTREMLCVGSAMAAYHFENQHVDKSKDEQRALKDVSIALDGARLVFPSLSFAFWQRKVRVK